MNPPLTPHERRTAAGVLASFVFGLLLGWALTTSQQTPTRPAPTTTHTFVTIAAGGVETLPPVTARR